MFEVILTPEAKALFVREATEFPMPGLTILRQGPKADVTRGTNGAAEWNVERPHPWRAMVGDFETFGENPTDVVVVEGISIWLALVPKPGELGVQVSVKNGALYVESLAA